MKGYRNFDGHMCLATLRMGGRQVPIPAYVCLCDTDLHACLLACNTRADVYFGNKVEVL